MTYPCSVCGKEFNTVPARVASGRTRCSRACLAADRGKLDVTCATCGKPFACFPFRLRRGCPVHCSRSCARLGQKGPRAGGWKGGNDWKASSGYVFAYTPTRKRGADYKHREVMAAVLGRPLLRSEVVHHINGDKLDNRPENLAVMTQSEHARLHAQQRKAVA